MMRMVWTKKMRTKNMKMNTKKINKKFLVSLKSSLKRKTQKTVSTQRKMWMNSKILLRKRKVKSKALEGLQIRKKHKNKRLKVFAASLSSKMMKMRTITLHPEMWRKTLTLAQMPVLWT